MENITLNVKKQYECDVLVVGGGVSGFASAVSAARNGARVILIESGGFLGGTATKGLVGPFMTCYDSKGQNKIIKGLFSELVDRLYQDGGAILPENCHGGDSYSGYRVSGHIGVTPFDYEVLKRVLESMCMEVGVKLLYHTTVIGCEKQENSISKVYAADNNDIISIKAKVFIDTTGSATLAYKAGAETMRDEKERQTASTFFIISGVNKKALDKYMEKSTDLRERFFMDVIEKGQENGAFPCGTKKLRIFENSSGDWVVNMAQYDDLLEELDGEAITNAEIEQRGQIEKIFKFLKENIIGLQNIRLESTASDIGIRESRRLVGKTVLTKEDIQKSTKFDDCICVCANSIDIHQKIGNTYLAYSGENYYIPLSCLISNDIENLLTAGKSLSADKYAFSAVRVMPPCIAMGQAVGITAALSVKNGVNVSDVPYQAVQEILLKEGAYLG